MTIEKILKAEILQYKKAAKLLRNYSNNISKLSDEEFNSKSEQEMKGIRFNLECLHFSLGYINGLEKALKIIKEVK